MNPIDLPPEILHAVLGCMTESYSLVDGQGRVVATGPNERNLLGRHRDEAKGRSAFADVHPDHLPETAAKFAELLRAPGSSQSLDVRCQHVDGTWRCLRTRGTNLLATEGVGHIVVTVSDVTAESEAVGALYARTALAERIVQHLEGGVFVRRLPGWEIVFTSEGMGRIWGRPARDVLATPEAFLASVHADDREVTATRLRAPADDTAQFRIIRPDGDIRMLTVRRLVLAEADGSAVVAGVVLDITEDLRLREAAGRSEQMEAISRLSLRLAHDFGNFVAAIQASAETLRFRPPTAAVEAEADLILETCTRTTDLVQRLLLLGRGPSHAPRDLALNREVASMITLLRRCVAGRVSVTLDCTLSDVPVRLDPVDLHRILLNLVANASQAMGGAGTVVIGTRAEAGFGVLTVSDSGPGIAPELRDGVFEPFATTRGERGGAGLGLAAVRAIVLGAGGVIEVGSSETGGARFEIRLPLSAVQA